MVVISAVVIREVDCNYSIMESMIQQFTERNLPRAKYGGQRSSDRLHVGNIHTCSRSFLTCLQSSGSFQRNSRSAVVTLWGLTFACTDNDGDAFNRLLVALGGLCSVKC